MKKKNRKSNTKVVATVHNIQMDKRKNVVIIKSNIDKMSEEDIKNLNKEIREEKQKIKDTYYALNSQIMKIEQRTFKDLVKKFIHQVWDDFNIKKGKSFVSKNRI